LDFSLPLLFTFIRTSIRVFCLLPLMAYYNSLTGNPIWLSFGFLQTKVYPSPWERSHCTRTI